MKWIETKAGFTSGRYEVVLREPRLWQLLAGGKSAGDHHSASAARVAAERLHHRRRRRNRAVRHVAVLAVVAAGMLVVFTARDTTNPEYDPALALTSEMQGAFDDITADRAEVTDFGSVTHGFDGAVVQGAVPIEVLVGMSASDCYVMYWGPEEVPRAGALVRSLPCVPESILGTSLQVNYQRFTPKYTFHMSWAPSGFTWDQVLPSPTRLPRWFFPAAFMLIVVGMYSLTSLSILALPGSEVPEPEPDPDRRWRQAAAVLA